MSISFWINKGPESLTYYECMCRGWTKQADPACTDCQGTGVYVAKNSSGGFSMTATNTRRMLECLKPHAPFVEVAESGEAINDVLWDLHAAANKAFADVIGDDYMRARLAAFRQLCLAAIHHDCNVHWG